MSAYAAYNRDGVDPTKQKEAVAEINRRLEAAEKAFAAELKEIEKIADEFDIEVYLSVGGHGSTYVPKLPADWDSSSCSCSSYDYRERGEWNSSSMSC